MDRRAWQALVHGLAKSQTWLRDFHFHGFSKSHLGMWEPNHKEGWAVKDWCLWIVVLEKTLESPLDCKEIKPVNPKGNQLWIFTGRADAKAEAPILWPSYAKANSLEKTLMLEKIEGKRTRWQERMRLLNSITTKWTWIWADFRR